MSNDQTVKNGVQLSAYLIRLSQQLVLDPYQEHGFSVPCVEITVQDRQHCDVFRSKPITSVIVKEEVDFYNTTEESDQIPLLQPFKNDDCLSERKLHNVCAMCLQSTLKSYHFKVSSSESKNAVIQEVFQLSKSETLESIRRWTFCELCFKTLENLHQSYLKFKDAQRIYQETLLRIRCFRKCAQKLTGSNSIDSQSNDDANNTIESGDNDHFDDVFNTESVNFELTEQQSPPEIMRLSKAKLKTTNSTGPKNKYNYKGKSIRRRGGLTEEEYREHRRAQMSGYYQRKKRKIDKTRKSEVSTSKTNVLAVKVDPEDTTRNSYPSSPISNFNITDPIDDRSNFDQLVDSLQVNPVHEKISSLSNKPLKRKKESVTKKTLKTKQKYDYKGKKIRRRGGITEEQYQEHRRAQSRQYYFDRMKRMGKLTYGPKSLSETARKKLEKAENACLDSSKLPARSSCGLVVPVIELEPGKRFSYRNVEFTKDEIGMHHCSKCTHAAKELNVMKKHIAKKHFDKEHGYKCSHCDKTFYYRYQLKYHEGRHTEKGAGIQCEECGMSFKYSSGYFNHRRIVHQGIKPHECKVCQRQFGTRKDLRKHTESKSHLARVLENKKTEVTDIFQEICNSSC